MQKEGENEHGRSQTAGKISAIHSLPRHLPQPSTGHLEYGQTHMHTQSFLGRQRLLQETVNVLSILGTTWGFYTFGSPKIPRVLKLRIPTLGKH